MVHLIFCLRRLPRVSPEEFHRYWRERHAPLVRRHAAALGIRRYVQAHATDPALSRALAATRGAPEGFDGVAELWFERLDTERLATPAAVAAGQALLEDERRFIDLERSPIFLAEDHVVIDEP